MQDEETNVEETFDEVLEDNSNDDESGEHEEDSGEETEVEMGDDLSSEDGGDTRNAKRDRAKAQIERLKEENKRLKEENRKATKEKGLGVNSTEIMAKAFLAATYDIKEPDAQEEALRLADKFDMTVDELMEDDDYRDRVSSIQKKVVNKRKVAASSGNAATSRRGAEYAAEYFKKNNSFPKDTPVEVRSKAIDIINGVQKQAWQ